MQGPSDGQCSVCGRAFERRVLRSVGSCPMHGQIRGEEGGRCPICHMGLAPITMEVQWICPRHPDVVGNGPGRCVQQDQPLVERIVPMPHGDHNPRHGGILFMAPDGFHHLEGHLSRSGSFRLYLYDNFTRPLDARLARARIGARFLSPVGEGEYLELALPPLQRFPAEVVLYVHFGPPATASAQESFERFDFVFAGEAEGAAPSEPTGPLALPSATEQMVVEILARVRRVEELMRRGAWTELYIPALEAKTLALALRERADRDLDLPVKRIVRAAWLLDLYGDQGNRAKVESAYELFRLGVQELEAAYATAVR